MCKQYLKNVKLKLKNKMITREDRRDSGEWKKSPVQHYATWKAGSDGGFFEQETYNKELNVNEKTQLTFTDFYFVGASNRLKGFDKNLGERGLSVQSNLIDFSKPEQRVVIKTKGGDKVFSGTYQEVKAWSENYKGADGKNILKSHIVLYVVHNGELYDLELKGSGLASWINFYEAHKYKKELYDNKISFTVETGKNGAVTYKTPKFQIGVVDSEELIHAERLGKELTEYFTQFENLQTVNKEDVEVKQKTEVVETEVKQKTSKEVLSFEEPKNDDIDDLPF